MLLETTQRLLGCIGGERCVLCSGQCPHRSDGDRPGADSRACSRDASLRKQLGVQVQGIAADILVKHATPVGDVDPIQVAQDTFHRGGADALIVTGSGTGKSINVDEAFRSFENPVLEGFHFGLEVG